MRRIGIFLVMLAAIVGSGSIRPAAAIPVDLELVLAVDVSRSIDDEEFNLQRQGYAAALTNPLVLGALLSGANRSTAVAFVEWADSEFQKLVVNWTLITGPESASRFAAAILAAPRSFYGRTSVSGAVDFGVALFAKNNYEGTRMVIDVSGDGINNSGRPAFLSRDDAVQKGVTINGLVIMNDKPPPGLLFQPQASLDEFYRDNVIGGPGAFMMTVEDFDSFGFAVVNKLIREIAGDPPHEAPSLADAAR